jgi:hypothetical protein
MRTVSLLIRLDRPKSRCRSNLVAGVFRLYHRVEGCGNSIPFVIFHFPFVIWGDFEHKQPEVLTNDK